MTLAALFGVAAGSRPAAAADGAASAVLLDRTVARFYAADLGGAEEPRFVLQRILAFEARLETMADNPDGVGAGYGESGLRSAFDRHVAEDIAASLAHKLIAGYPPSRRPGPDELGRVKELLRAALYDRLGGRGRVEAAAQAEQVEARELDALLETRSLAAWYIDRAMTPILQANEEQLREVFRTATHPFRGRAYADVREPLQRWFAFERLRIAEIAFLQSSRERIRIVVTP
jgi:hypothetical protein